jgi:hypothetical protein
MKQIKIRCSEFGNILAKGKTDDISVGAKSYIEKLFIENEYGFSEDVFTDPMLKGTMLEPKAINLVAKLDQEFYTKNEFNFSNDYLTGTPDIIADTKIIDIKIPDTFKTFFNADLSSLYYAQGQGYMYLTGVHKFELTYVLMPEPDSFLSQRLLRLSYKLTQDQYYKAEQKLLNNNKIIEALPLSQRVRKFAFDYDPEFIENGIRIIDKCRIYYETLFTKFNLK